jgi:hypothetical protein
MGVEDNQRPDRAARSRSRSHSGRRPLSCPSGVTSLTPRDRGGLYRCSTWASILSAVCRVEWTNGRQSGQAARSMGHDGRLRWLINCYAGAPPHARRPRVVNEAKHDEEERPQLN